MPSPLTVKRNNYIENPKRSDIPTPQRVADFIASLFPDVESVFDPCVGTGVLLRPFNGRCRTLGIDILAGTDYLSLDKLDDDFELVVCNPPFNLGVGRKLGSEVFLEKTLQLLPKAKILMFVPMGFRLNQRQKSKRWPWLRDECPPITSIISLPLDIFEGVLFHNEIVVFNAPELDAHYFLPEIKTRGGKSR